MYQTLHQALTLVAASCLIPCGCRGCPCGARRDLADRAQRTLKAPTLDPNNDVHAIKCGLQIFNSSLVLAFYLIEVPLEVSLCSGDLLRKQIGPVLQVATDVTHLMIPQSSPHVRKRSSRTAVPIQPLGTQKCETVRLCSNVHSAGT
jgi:hypothetical protein